MQVGAKRPELRVMSQNVSSTPEPDDESESAAAPEPTPNPGSEEFGKSSLLQLSRVTLG